MTAVSSIITFPKILLPDISLSEVFPDKKSKYSSNPAKKSFGCPMSIQKPFKVNEQISLSLAIKGKISLSISRGPCSFPRARRPSFGVVPPPAGGGATGHPIEYIQLNKRAGPSPTACKYCGLRYVGTGHHH